MADYATGEYPPDRVIAIDIVPNDLGSYHVVRRWASGIGELVAELVSEGVAGQLAAEFREEYGLTESEAA